METKKSEQGSPETRTRKWRLALGALTVVATAALIGARQIEARVRRAGEGRVYSVANAPAKPVAIVLGARVTAAGDPYPILEHRLQCALDLYRSGRVRDVLVSGDHGRAHYDEVNAMRRWLVERGVPAAHVYMDHAGFRTLDTMARARDVFAVRQAAVCTQAFHLGRSLWLADRMGVEAVGVIADRGAYPGRRLNAAREWIARVRAAIDTELLGASPRFGGPRIPIGESDPRETYDAHTRAADARPPQSSRTRVAGSVENTPS